jgi:hypothetical protein
MNAQDEAYKSMRLHPESITISYKCQHEGRKDRHHSDYSKPLCVMLLCKKCHIAEHLQYRKRRGTYEAERTDLGKVSEFLIAKCWNYRDLANALNWSYNKTHHAINNGGKSFAPKIAAVLGIEPESIITSIRKGGPRQESDQCGASAVNPGQP